MLTNKGAHAYNGNMIICKQCGKTFDALRYKQQHVCYKCSKCNDIFLKKQNFDRHQCKKENVCKFCNKTYSSKTTLLKHKCSHCEICNKTFSTFQKKKGHNCHKHPEQEKLPEGQLATPKETHSQKHLKTDQFIHSQAVYDVSSSQADLEFNPVRSNWQRQKCALLGIRGQPSFEVKEKRKPLTKPKHIQTIKGDGNCFFRSIAFAVSGDQNKHSHFRGICVKHMLKNEFYLKKTLPPDISSISEYLRKNQVDKNGTWATEVEIFAMAHLLKTDIYIYTLTANSPKWLNHATSFIEPTTVSSRQKIYLNHKNGNHYEVVLDVIETPATLPDAFRTQHQDSRMIEELKEQIKKSSMPVSSNRTISSLDDFEKNEARREKERLRIAEKRKNDRFKQNENKRKRLSETSRFKEREIKIENRKRDEYKESENKRKRESESGRIIERDIKRAKRKTTQKRESENIRKRESETNRMMERDIKRTKRKTGQQRESENERKRSSETNRMMERDIKRTKRKTGQQRESENIRKRESETNRMMERDIKRTKRKTGQQRESENKRKRSSETNRMMERDIKRTKRKTGQQRESENKRKRSSETNRMTERDIKRKKRKSEELRQQENERKKLCVENRYKEKEHKQMKRSDNSYRENEKENKLKSVTDLNTASRIAKFHDIVENGPLYVCSCCKQLWYRESVILATSVSVTEDLKPQVLTCTLSAQDKEWMCLTCASYIRRKKLPPLSEVNLKFAKKPECLYLTNLEERLISPRIPFMMLHELPRGGQISINGNVVNVPSDVNSTVTHLPRGISNDTTIALKLKRKLSYKHHVIHQSIRPNQIRNALEYLVSNSPLYKEEGITIDENWDHIPTENQVQQEKDHITPSEEDIWDERDIDSMPGGTMDTLLQPEDPLANQAGDILSFAPAEGNNPISIFTDTYSEELAFPTIFCGQKREVNAKISYNDICKSELRRDDRRAAGHVPNIFFKLKKLQAKHINERANVVLRKTKGNINKMAADVKSAEQLSLLIRHDEGYKILKDLRGSPPYWEKTKKDLFAMLRVLGIPTWFMSFSSAETRWVHLLKILSQAVHGKELSTEQVLGLTFFEKSELIKKDPVTCARHFNHQVKKLISTILKTSQSPVGEVKDFFYKVEFQMRGSPHIHMLAWVKGAPTLHDNKGNENTVVEFIDAHSTCERDPQLEELVKLQEHNHSRTCRKKGENICRFQFPLPPMEETCLLEPLDPTVPDDQQKGYIQSWKKVSKVLNNLRKETKCTLTFPDFLETINLTAEEYIMAVRSSICRRQLFLKRNVNEIQINNYNKELLQCWRANIDIQYILDPYACAVYIVSYIAKSQRGMSNLLYEAVKESKEGNTEVRHQVKTIGHKFLNHVEVSAQEAVFYVLQMPLKHSSRQVVFINTSPSDQRVVMLKTFTALKNLEDESTDITTTSILERYSKRPGVLENICLADFVSNFRICYKSYKHSGDTESDSEEDDITKESKCFKLPDGNILRRRQHPVVIRYVRYQQLMDQENYFREILMLFHPWRLEEAIIGDCETFTDRYIQVSNISSLEDKMSEYNHQFAELDRALEDIETLRLNDLSEGFNNINAHQRAVEDEESNIGVKESDEYQSFAPQSDDIRHFSEFKQESSSHIEQQKKYISDKEYHSLARLLNSNQKNFFLHVLHHFKTSEEPFYTFLSGGAGVGKTMVITVLYQALIRWFNSKKEANPDSSKVLLAAPTGKAAYLIKGSTLHSLLHIPANQGFQYIPLRSDTLNTLRKTFIDVKLLIIDEISMVGNKMLDFVNKRLQQITGTTRLFGGISILAVGDLFQLKPVFDGWIFDLLRNDYGPIATNIWKDNFKLFELDEIMRQKESKQFAELLNRLRQNCHTPEDIVMLRSREIGTDMLHPDYPLKTPHIYTRNLDVNSHNSMVCEMQDEGKFESKALDVVLGDVNVEVKAQILLKIPQDTAKTMGLPTELKTALQLRHELSCNVDIEDGMANGASFLLVGTGPKDKVGKYRYVWAKFDDEKIGQLCREKNKNCYSNSICKTWTPLYQIKRQFPVGRYKNVLVLRSQFPFRCAVAKSCHRCQGDTMESAVVDFSGRCFFHSHYVALSRVTKIENLHIRNLNEKKINVDQKVCLEMKRLRSQTLMSLQQSIEVKDSLVVLFHNIRSQQGHILDIKSSELYQQPHVNVFSETKLHSKIESTDLNIPGYFLTRYDSTNRAYGLSFYIKDTVKSTPVHHAYEFHGKEYLEIAMIDVQTPLGHMPFITVGAVYISPTVSTTHLKEFLNKAYHKLSSKNQPYILLGDFNVDITGKQHTYLMDILHCSQGVKEPTTDWNSLLDHIYVCDSLSRYQCQVFESYFSDHKAVVITLK